MDGFAGPTRRRTTKSADAAQLGINDLIWHEVADAVWLMAVTQELGRRKEISAEQIAPEPTPPSGPPADRTEEPETADLDFDSDRAADTYHATSEPTTGEPAHFLQTGPGEVPYHKITFLPGSANIIRALRPLKIKALSRRAEEIVLDEEATAERAVQDGLWLPVTKPDTARWLDLTLVVDTSPSMTLWRSTVKAFISLMERLGAFRTIQLRLLDTHRPAGSPARPVLRGGTGATPIHSPAELLDPSGRRIVLVLTDGVGRCWRQHLVSPLLARWGKVMPLALVNLLPQHQWERNGLALFRAQLTVPGPLRPNRFWDVELPDAWLEPDPASVVPAGAVPVPVLELGARWLGWWARLITGNLVDPSIATIMLAATPPHQPSAPASSWESETSDRRRSADERVQDFLGVASPAAFRLATLLATLPVNLPLARLVQAELVPESGTDHLAEVFNSGLLKPSGVTVGGHTPETTTFDFPDPVREVLLSGARRSETARVVHLVAEHSDDNSARRIAAALCAPENTPLPSRAADTASSVATERMLLCALSGPYLGRAAQIHPAEQGEQPMRGTGSSAEEIKAATLPDVTQHTPVASPSTRSQPPAPDSPTIGPTPSDERASGDIGDARYMDSHTATGNTAREAKPHDPTPIWGNVPLRNPMFTGRKELLSLLSRHLTAGSTTAVLPAALYGMGGIGKTQTAVEYIYRHTQDYDIIWWIPASESAQIRAGLTELAQRLELPGCTEANTAVPAVQEALRIGEPYRNWLLVFDSAESPEVVRPFFPASEFGTILVTSRNPGWAEVADPLEVTVFKREESRELLKRRGPEIDDEEADQLAEKLGDLPLAIAQAAAWRAETGMPIREYIRLFDEKRAEILDTSAPTDYETSVAAAWKVSFDELEERNPAAHQLLQVCAFFAPDPISRDLFTRVKGNSISPELDAALQDPMRLSRTIRDIHRYGLAKIDHRHNTLQLHRLVQLVLSNLMTEQHRQKMRHGAHILLANHDPNDPVPAKQWPQYLNVLPHAYSANVIGCDDSWVRQLVINLTIFLYHWGDHEEACRLAQQAVKAWTLKLGEADPQTLQAAERLGFYLWTLGRFDEAARINQQTLKRHRETSGENSEETFVAEMAVATDLKGSGDFLAALDLNTHIYQKARALFGDDDPTTLLTAHDTVVSLGLAGQYRKGSELAEDTYQRRIEVIGYDNPGTMSTLNALILARREAGDYTWARIEQEKVAQRSGELFGVDRAATLRRRHHLSVARRKDGDHPGALKLSTEVLESFQIRYGKDHPNVMACALAKSIDLRHADNLHEARALGEETFERYRRKLGENHPHTLSARLDLAVTLRLLGDATGAREVDERVLEQFRTALGADHPHAIVSAINLASDLAATGEAEAALATGTEALERAQRVLGPDHPTTLAATMNLVLDLRSLGRAEEAETKYVEVLTRYHRVLGDKHPATRNAAEGIRADCDIDPLPL